MFRNINASIFKRFATLLQHKRRILKWQPVVIFFYKLKTSFMLMFYMQKFSHIPLNIRILIFPQKFDRHQLCGCFFYIYLKICIFVVSGEKSFMGVCECTHCESNIWLTDKGKHDLAGQKLWVKVCSFWEVY